ncbi:MAG: GTP pyrophosphokinase family protein [Lachnospiraceae bacterium]|nr:GTP pyrophosphokinase family protein [Lachnospiraceae bacterium]
MDIYGKYRPAMEEVLQYLAGRVEENGKSENGEKLYEHLSLRIKSDESMREKLQRKGLEENEKNALQVLKDAIGMRVVCLFVDDVYECVQRIRNFERLKVLEEKDYILDAKPNGYRSYHMIVEVTSDEEDVDGNVPGHFYAEIQLRTIAMDTWAALEHELKYKKNISNQEMIIQELHRCANDLAACDVSMQTLRKIIRQIP